MSGPLGLALRHGFGADGPLGIRFGGRESRADLWGGSQKAK